MSEQDRDQRTEAPTPQRLRKAQQDGQIGFSSELLGSVVFAAGVLYFWMAGTWFFTSIGQVMYDRSTYFTSAIHDPLSIKSMMAHDITRCGLAVLGLMLPLFVITALVGGLQTNFNISFKPLELKWDKLSVPKGFGRIFSSKSVVRGVMAVLKASVVVLIAYLIARFRFDDIVAAGTVSYQHMIFVMCEIILYLSLATAATIALLGVADLAFQKWKHHQELKMSIRDIRDEQKDTDGDPQLRARIRRLQTEMSKQRMVQEVPNASVVITNPTHFAVAVQYDQDSMAAPKVIAKGGDLLAKKIIEVAKQNGVPVVERKPVARFLFFNVKIGQSIPQELYEAVAEVLNFIRRFDLDRRRR